MKFRCPHCGEKTITFKEKMKVGNIFPYECRNCKKGYVNNKRSAFYAAAIGIIVFVLIPRDAEAIWMILFLIGYFLLFATIYLFTPTKPSDIDY